LGLSVVPPGQAKVDAVIADALGVRRQGRRPRGNQSIMSDRADNDSRVMSYDKVWVKHIKTALMENRFGWCSSRLRVFRAERPGMFDVLVRMIDQQGREVLPSEFMAAAGSQRPAEEHRPLGRRRVAVVCGAERKPECLFVRLSRETVRDGSFLEWLSNHLRSSHAEAQRLCFQITEESAASYVTQVKALATALRARRFRFALEGFGSGRDSVGMLESLPLDFVENRRHHHPGTGRGSAAAATRAPRWSKPHAGTASRPSGSGSRTPTPWRCCGRWRAIRPGLLDQRARASGARRALKLRSSRPGPGRKRLKTLVELEPLVVAFSTRCAPT